MSAAGTITGQARVLKQFSYLNKIANFPNSAYKLPQVKRLELVFKQHNAYGHMGARKFWLENLKTINFHNPKVEIDVKRILCETKDEQLKCPSVLKVYFEDGKTQQIDCKNKRSGAIMEELVKITEAEKVDDADIPVLTIDSFVEAQQQTKN
ncbi:unnamed protein product [Ambrosiozyma monospora]|uniref:Unnamed protein product n=1 Tax=Ambrosiozyma monospora TaxID=43982 RepID=A0A9W6YN54_AMBMO|nr:unnamed protein product [Ambrosiozyma monospora]